jgi:hypothetical protein
MVSILEEWTQFYNSVDEIDHLQKPNKATHRSTPMSTDNDLISSFRQAAEALEKLPQLQESHSQKEAALAQATEYNTHLLSTIETLTTSINELKGRVRSLEVERDDAGFRELEAKDKLEALLRTLSAVAGTASAAVKEHTPQPEVIEPSAAAEVETKVVEAPSEPISAVDGKYGNPYTDFNVDAPEPKPTAGEWHAPRIEEVTQPLPFLNIPAQDKPDSVSWKDFVAGGGRRPFWVTDEMMELGAPTSSAA